MRSLYTVFHLNLMFSSVEEEQRSDVIRACYWPLLDLAESHIPVGIEMTGITARLIAAIDPAWVEAFRRLHRSGRVELIGSGHAQLIGPLVPARVNRANLACGAVDYDEVFGVRPTIALVNEMAYSAGLVEHYAAAGYAGIIMEWNNAARFHDWPRETSTEVCRLESGMGASLDLLWADSIFFQQLQRYAHGAIDRRQYLEFLDERFGSVPGSESSHGAWYCSDAEVFDFRPGRFEAEENLHAGEWERIAGLTDELQREGRFRFALPRDALRSGAGDRAPVIRLESPEQPVVVKKQRKYNLNRWALSGRANLEINTRCFHLAESRPQLADAELCELWSSDYRTHITERRWEAYRERLRSAAGSSDLSRPGSDWPADAQARVTDEKGGVALESDDLRVRLDAGAGLTIREFGRAGERPVMGLIPHGTFSTIEYAADFFSGHVVIHRPGKRLRSSVDKRLLHHKIEVAGGGVEARQVFDWGEVLTGYRLAEGALVVTRELRLPARLPEIVRLFGFSFPPAAWSRSSLAYLSHNGGARLERFPLEGRAVDHGAPVSWFTSSEFGLGMTEGEFVIEDRASAVKFELCPHGDRVLPKVTYRELPDDQFFLRADFSAQEIDETFVGSDAPQIFRAALRISMPPATQHPLS